MKTYLVALSLGPVQSLIEAARRTRDLWCGSWLLAEAAKAAALALHENQPGCLIFPCPDNPEEELAPSKKPKDTDANIANILRAQIELPDEAAVRKLLECAKQAAEQRLADLCDQARTDLKALPFHEGLWEAQKQDILESFAAWVEIKDGNYPQAAKRLGSLLAARKTTRDFKPGAASADGPGFGIPKSSLDGARESVINIPRKERTAARYQTDLRRLGVTGGEELDALAIAKRRAVEVEQFTAYSRIAADAWIQDLEAARREAIIQAYKPLVEADLATKVSGNGGIYSDLPYDAQLVFGFRLDNALADNRDDESQKLLKALRDAREGVDEPTPYAVILKADGDRMGELLSKAANPAQSRAISTALHGFARAVRGIVRDHRGHAIYAGGDDVLAMLPLEHAIDCAAALAKTFKAALNDVAGSLGIPAGERPTLSVGLGIGHLVEPLGGLRARADAAEKRAKGNGEKEPRNALAIHLGIRSGVQTDWRCRWGEGDPQACVGIQAMQAFVKAYRENHCPSRLGFELRSIAQRLSRVNTDDKPLPGIHAAELARTLARARECCGEGELPSDLKRLLKKRAGEIGLARLADELIIARWLSARTKSDLGVLE
ncbi:MAG: type III-B CRISPR-associated protein Cas10/Cmr2 [Sulfuricellaceae bacterium]